MSDMILATIIICCTIIVLALIFYYICQLSTLRAEQIKIKQELNDKLLEKMYIDSGLAESMKEIKEKTKGE